MTTRSIAIACMAFIFLCESTAQVDAANLSKKQRLSNKAKTKIGTYNARQKEKKETKARQTAQVQKRANAREEALTNAVQTVLKRTEADIGFSELLDTYGEIHATNRKAEIISDMSKATSSGQAAGKKMWIQRDLQNISKNGKRIKSTKWDSNLLGNIPTDVSTSKLMKDVVKASTTSCEKAETCANNLVKNYKKATDTVWQNVLQEDQRTAKQGKGQAKFFNPNSKDGKGKINSWANAHKQTVLS